MVQWLLHHTPADPNIALTTAAVKGYPAMVNYLLTQSNIDLNTALIDAVSCNQLQITKILFNHGADDVKKSIRTAARYGASKVLDWLLH